MDPLLAKAAFAIGPALLLAAPTPWVPVRWQRAVAAVAVSLGMLPALIHGGGSVGQWQWFAPAAASFAMAAAAGGLRSPAWRWSTLGLFGVLGAGAAAASMYPGDGLDRWLPLLGVPLALLAVTTLRRGTTRLDAAAVLAIAAALGLSILFSGMEALALVYATLPTIAVVVAFAAMRKPAVADAAFVLLPAMAVSGGIAWNANVDVPAERVAHLFVLAVAPALLALPAKWQPGWAVMAIAAVVTVHTFALTDLAAYGF